MSRAKVALGVPLALAADMGTWSPTWLSTGASY